MQIVRGFILFIFIPFILLGNSGLRVFKHSCEEDGIFTSYIIPADDHCTDHQEDLPPCCIQEKQKDDCCSDEVEIYKVKFDFFQNEQIDLPYFLIIPEPIYFKCNEINPIQAKRAQAILRPPPDGPSGQEILILNQVFRI